MTAPSGCTRIVRTARLVGRLVRGLLAATLLAALVAGLPAALIVGVGWPLPAHVPSLDEVGAVLMAPMSAHVLLDTLACLAWLLWLAFVVDVAGCAVDVARGARWAHLRRQRGPVRRIAAGLVGAVLIAVLGRTATAAPAVPTGAARPGGNTSLVATAPNKTVPTTVMPIAGEHTGMPLTEHRASAEPGTERVRPPEDGVYDSLWRVAQRCLGDGDRWPEIWALNEGSTQPGGRVLTNPNLIHPGDRLRLPGSGSPAAPAVAPRPAPANSPSPATEPAPPTPSTTAPPPAEPPSPAAPTSAPTAGEPAAGAASWDGGEVFVSLGLAAAVSALLLLARRRRHARYQPGSGRRHDDLPVAPVVYQLRLAHLRAQHHDDDADLDTEPDAEPQAETGHVLDDPAAREHRHKTAQVTAAPGDAAQLRVLAPRIRRVVAGRPGSGGAASTAVVDIALDATASGVDGATTNAAAGGGVRVALDLARVHGLGLVGPGGYAAARALLLTIITAPRSGPAPRVLVPDDDLARLLGVPVPATGLPDTVTVVADLNTALATLGMPDTAAPRPAVLVAAPPTEPDRQARLQQLLDNGAQHGLSALLLGQWRAGVTAYVTARGVISATDPGVGEPLRGTRAFTLPETATRDLLAFLHATQPEEAAHGEPGAGPDYDAAATLPTQHPTATPPKAAPAHPDNSPAVSARLEITSGPAVAEPSPAASGETGGDPRPLPQPADDTEPGTPAPLALTVFGAPALRWRPEPGRSGREPQDLSGVLSSRPVELLVFLAVHPGGVSRDAIIDALWPGEPPRNPASVLRTILSRIRRALDTATHGAAGDLVHAEHGQYQLAPAVVDVDYWDFADAVTRRRTATTAEARTDAYEAIVAHYGGPLADGLDSDWLVAAREATRRDALDAVAALARARVETDPDHTLDLLETARAFDPHNELLYRDIMRLQHALGRHDTISRTLTLLQTRLAEIDATPTAGTIDLAERLRARNTGIPVDDITRSTAS
ncbi:Transcriptional regulatory protein, C terminal [Amycolatopsis tolypomycina]|uniref:Transcriptional regulatory protein, C terminal n=1 Tax=Amycolatopsis tolypomycina TaxID=208445 RepID=A0A1H4JKX0_9PSEU|nr:BTAD domain-containing putative transcriptional regulator [Amycolatopsis tolypomycina]SEB46308.1 Transcriptional regulatory protein, C terminal [Amycolatopsis tolypomycina]